MNAYISAVFRACAGNNSISPSAIQRTTVNGIPASYSTARVNSQSGQVDVTVFAYEFSRGQAFHFVALTQAGRGGVFNPMFGSVRRLSSAEATAIRPRRIDVVTVGTGDTVASLARRMAQKNYSSEKRSVGQERVSTVKYKWWPHHIKKNI